MSLFCPGRYLAQRLALNASTASQPRICLQCRLALQPFAPRSPSREFGTSSPLLVARKVKARALNKLREPSRGPAPVSNEDTQTDFGALDILGNTPAPATGIDVCTSDGFVLNNDIRVSGSGVLLVDGECFAWRPWLREDEGKTGTLLSKTGAWEADQSAWGVLDLVWPKPDLLIIGTGASVRPITPQTRKHINDLGIRVEVQDTRNASAQFNLLATERGIQQVAAALVPLDWEGNKK